MLAQAIHPFHSFQGQSVNPNNDAYEDLVTRSGGCLGFFKGNALRRCVKLTYLTVLIAPDIDALQNRKRIFFQLIILET